MTRLLSEAEATGKAQQVFEEIKQSFGMVPNFFKAQAAVDADWLEINWKRVKRTMLDAGPLDRKTRELIALAVSLVNRCEYCSQAHEAIALASGATPAEVNQLRQVVELFVSFNLIADSLRVPCDIAPDALH